MVVVVVLTLVNIKLTAKITAASTTTTTVLRLEVLNWNLNKSYKTDLNIQNFPSFENIYKSVVVKTFVQRPFCCK